MGRRSEEDGEYLKSLLQRVDREVVRETQDGNGRQCEGSFEVGVSELKVIPSCSPCRAVGKMDGHSN